MSIIVAVDRTGPRTPLLREARALADAFGDELYVVHTMNQSTFRELETESVETTGKTIDLNDVREMARGVATEAADEAGIDAKTVGLVGDPADAVLKHANNENARYIVVGGKRRSPVGKALFGSVTQTLLLDSELPVVTVMIEDQ